MIKKKRDQVFEDQSINEQIELLHKEACEAQEDYYTDPYTNFIVFTNQYHLKRGYCCGAGCRHCPYDWENVKR
jgi:hypothetical protein